jgi:hypothetical protein
MPEAPDKLEITSASSSTIDRLVQRSRRTSGARLPSSFSRADAGDTTLARLIRGGRGGGVRTKLYLSTVLVAGSKRIHPQFGRNAIFDISAPAWARVLALPDPGHAGARRISDAQNQLADLKLIELERRASKPAVVRLLHPSRSGREWVEPGYPYLRVPLDIWSNRWLWFLTGKELAVLLAIIDLCGGQGVDGTGGPQPLSGTNLRGYGMSEDTWRIASASLEAMGLIRTNSAVVHADLMTPRRRKRYQLVPDSLSSHPPFSGPY